MAKDLMAGRSGDSAIIGTDSARQVAKSVSDVQLRVEELGRRPFLSKILYRQEYNAISAARVREIENHLNDTEGLKQMLRKSAAQELENRLNAYVITRGVEVDLQLEVEINDMIFRAKEELGRITDKFIDMFQNEYDNLEKIRIPVIKEKKETQLNAEIDAFFNRQKKLDQSIEERLEFRASKRSR